MRNIWMDSPERYGLISRAFHWGMAYLLIWQFLIILLWRVFGPLPVVKVITELGPYHATVGACVLVLVLMRGIWSLFNKAQRPPKDGGWKGLIAAVVHLAFYALMFLIPALAVARTYGNGKGWTQWGMQIVPATGRETAWLVTPADWLHGLLSWSLLVLIVGHIAMALVHRLLMKDQILVRMAGKLR